MQAIASEKFTVDGIVYKPLQFTAYGINCVEVVYDDNKLVEDPSTHKFIGTTYTGIVTIPETVTYKDITYNVTTIGTDAFHGCQNLTKVVLPNSLKEIGIQAFRNCPALTSINFPEGLEIIRYDAFTYDSGLTEIVLPSSLKLIDGYAFCECRGLKRVILSDSDIPLEKPQFYGCSAIFKQINVDYAYMGRMGADGPVNIDAKELVLGNAVTSLSEAYFNPATLEKITIPPSVKTINKEAFKNASHLKDITIQDGDSPIYLQRTVYTEHNGNSTYQTYLYCFQNTILEHAYIGRNFNPSSGLGFPTDYDANGSAFAYTTTLKSVELGPKVTHLSPYSFLRCENLETIDFSKAPIAQIYEGCFSDCSSLTSVSLPPTLQSIKYRAYDACRKLRAVSFPECLSEIGESAFASCGLEALDIPGSVKTIAKSAFASNTNLQELVLGEGIETISESAFYNCSSLTRLSIPSSVIALKKNAFAELASLSSLRFEDGTKDLNCDYITYGSDNGKKCEPVFYKSTKNLQEIYIGREFPFDHFIGTNQYVHDFTEFFGYSYEDDFNCSPTVTYGPTVYSTAKGMFKRFTNLKKVVCLGTYKIPYCYDTFFSPGQINLYVPKGYADTYVNYYFWQGFASVQENINPTRISLNRTSASLRKNESLTLTATVYPTNATEQNIEWSSSDVSVLTVSENGVVTAVGVGQASITAAIRNYPAIKTTCKFSVSSPLATSISFVQPETIVFAGHTTQLMVNVYPDEASTDITLSTTSVDGSLTDIIIYSASENGTVVIDGLYPGKVNLIARTTDGSNLADTCTVNVCDIAFQDSHITLGKGQSYDLSPIISTASDEDLTYVWESSDNAVASVTESGRITAGTSGAAIITCTPAGHDDVSISCEVEVGDLFDKNLFVETAVSTREMFSVRGYAEMEMYQSLSIENSEAKVIPVAVHMNFGEYKDPMYIPGYSSLVGKLTGALPSFIYNRASSTLTQASSTESIFASETAGRLLGQKSVFGLEITSVEYSNNRQLTANICITAGRNSTNTYRMAAILVENNVTNTAPQTNHVYYNYTPEMIPENDWKWMSPYCANGIYGQSIIPASDMIYQRVARGIFPSFDGEDIGNDWHEGTSHSTTISFDVPDNIQDLSNCELIVILLDDKGRVVNSASIPYSQFMTPTPLITSLSLDKTFLSLEVGTEEYIVATVTPSYIEYPALEWSSANPEIATVNNGIVTAIGAGTTTITVATADGSEIYAECIVTVSPLTGIATIGCDDIVIITRPLGATIHGISEGTIIRLFDISGKALYIGTTPNIEVSQPGTYLLIVSDKLYKLRL